LENDAGWREGYWVINDRMRWASFQGEPRFDALMERVLEHIAAQREKVEALDREDNFRARLGRGGTH
jgi:hypothetical protein